MPEDEPEGFKQAAVTEQGPGSPAELTLLNELQARSRHLTYFRLAFAAIVLVFSFLVQKFGVQDFDPLGLVAASFSVLVLNLTGLYLLSPSFALSRSLLYLINAVLLACDTAALSYVVHLTQGVESDLFFLYLLPILLASNVYGRTGIFLTAIASSLAYFITVVGENASFLPYLNSGGDSSGLTSAYAQRLFLQVGSRGGILFVVSMIWAAFCHRMSAVAQESTFKLSEQLSANTRLLEEIRSQSRKERLSNSINLALRRTLDPEKILSTTCSELSEALNQCNCFLVTRDHAIWDSELISGRSKESKINKKIRQYLLEHNWPRKNDESPLSKLVIAAAPFDSDELRPISAELMTLRIESILLRPIKYGDELKGVLGIISAKNSAKWQNSELELIDGVAGQVAIAIEHAELLAKLSENNEDLLKQNADLDSKNLQLRQMQSQLIHQEKMASLGRIVAGIAHELNNPINFVHGNLPYLKQYFSEMKAVIACFDEIPPEYRAAADTKRKEINYDFVLTDLDNIIADLAEGTERIRQIIRNLRSFSRLDEAELKEASIEESIESTIKILSQYYGKDKIPVEFKFCNSPPLLCHPGKLNQVWMNLLANAAQALEKKGEDGRVIVRTQEEADSILVSIEDNGPGINVLDQSKIFEPFFTTKPVGQGTGLGLSISHSIVERHGGQIWFESEAGKGTRFFVRLPLKMPTDSSSEMDLEEPALLESEDGAR